MEERGAGNLLLSYQSRGQESSPVWEELRTMDIEKLWEATLADLQLQVTRSTYDTWFRGTRPLYLEKGKLLVGTSSAYALEWLEGRLQHITDDTLKRHGHPGGAKFTVVGSTPPAAPDAPLAEVAREQETAKAALPAAVLELMDFDATSKGWIQTPAYAIQFWQPYLGLGPFNAWQTLRSYALQTGKWPTITTLADILCKGSRQRLTGRTLKAGHQKGWLEILVEEKILWHRLKGQDYIFRVMDRLPLLTPQQVGTLSKARQRAHTKFLTLTHLDLREWQQLTLDTLSKGVEGV